ncbi:unnamed protein product [Nippostrongylus brasiliensis]|uniref:P-type phospholipid transporter n=1 Tax=Nippostrongylus brasiliensis TaxID=27835 RepID=A0A0N4XJZ3_NIPBR|nr:unnamed protein product [Nippostrongylus brasiliensis]
MEKIENFQQIPDVSPTGRYTTAVPLLLILSVSAVKEIFEDIVRCLLDRHNFAFFNFTNSTITNTRIVKISSIQKRRASDRKVNSFRAFILENKEFQSREWQEVRVGDVLRVDSDQLFPADLLLLSSSEPQGMCYIETSNLDGETNLKIKQALPATSELTTIDKLNAFEAQIECELPTRHVNEFSGNIVVKETYPFGIDQLLLRGARLKHTAWVYGAAIYTGHDAKLLMNTKRAPLKRYGTDILLINVVDKLMRN